MEFQIYDHWTELETTLAHQIDQLLTVSFPPEERRSTEELHQILSDPHLQLLTAEENGKVYGMITVWDLENITFLEHFAVVPGYRGRGLGTQILNSVEEFWDKPAVLEVEHPTGITERRRIGFYERNGFVLNSYPYLMPDLHGGSLAVPLLLMSKPAALEAPAKTEQLIYSIPYAGKHRPR